MPLTRQYREGEGISIYDDNTGEKILEAIIREIHKAERVPGASKTADLNIRDIRKNETRELSLRDKQTIYQLDKEGHPDIDVMINRKQGGLGIKLSFKAPSRYRFERIQQD
jgi:hypothetical protein